MLNDREILTYFPTRIASVIDHELKKLEINMNYLEEIRLRSNRPLILKLADSEKKLDIGIRTEDILETLQHACDNSIQRI